MLLQGVPGIRLNCSGESEVLLWQPHKPYNSAIAGTAVPIYSLYSFSLFKVIWIIIIIINPFLCHHLCTITTVWRHANMVSFLGISYSICSCRDSSYGWFCLTLCFLSIFALHFFVTFTLFLKHEVCLFIKRTILCTISTNMANIHFVSIKSCEKQIVHQIPNIYAKFALQCSEITHIMMTVKLLYYFTIKKQRKEKKSPQSTKSYSTHLTAKNWSEQEPATYEAECGEKTNFHHLKKLVILVNFSLGQTTGFTYLSILEDCWNIKML